MEFGDQALSILARLSLDGAEGDKERLTCTPKPALFATSAPVSPFSSHPTWFDIALTFAGDPSSPPGTLPCGLADGPGSVAATFTPLPFAVEVPTR